MNFDREYTNQEIEDFAKRIFPKSDFSDYNAKIDYDNINYKSYAKKYKPDFYKKARLLSDLTDDEVMNLWLDDFNEVKAHLKAQNPLGFHMFKFKTYEKNKKYHKPISWYSEERVLFKTVPDKFVNLVIMNKPNDIDMGTPLFFNNNKCFTYIIEYEGRELYRMSFDIQNRVRYIAFQGGYRRHEQGYFIPSEKIQMFGQPLYEFMINKIYMMETIRYFFSEQGKYRKMNIEEFLSNRLPIEKVAKVLENVIIYFHSCRSKAHPMAKVYPYKKIGNLMVACGDLYHSKNSLLLQYAGSPSHIADPIGYEVKKYNDKVLNKYGKLARLRDRLLQTRSALTMGALILSLPVLVPFLIIWFISLIPVMFLGRIFILRPDMKNMDTAMGVLAIIAGIIALFWSYDIVIENMDIIKYYGSIGVNKFAEFIGSAVRSFNV